MKKYLLMLAATAALSATAVQAHNFESSDDAIQYRQSGFSLMAYNFGDIGAMLKGKKDFDADVAAMRAANVAALAKLPLEGFIDGSDKGNTEALAKIWADKADFEAKFTELQTNADALAIAAKGGDKNELKKAFGAVGKSCKGCHDVYKKD
ncbi:c-type cytochrome [Shewanella algae]|uniref:c-type cytochrome n=1 Tax=Shewanella algae TaxID=38313 RepID=UPI001AACCD8C|nr:cytochrome c [Shewanella algae]MBO2688905.1 cytochrome c [Shewanella algae]